MGLIEFKSPSEKTTTVESTMNIYLKLFMMLVALIVAITTIGVEGFRCKGWGQSCSASYECCGGFYCSDASGMWACLKRAPPPHRGLKNIEKRSSRRCFRTGYCIQHQWFDYYEGPGCKASYWVEG